MTEYVSGELGGKIKAITCEWSQGVKEGAEPDSYLQSATTYERLLNGQIKLTFDARSSDQPRKYGSMTIHKVSPELCP